MGDRGIASNRLDSDSSYEVLLVSASAAWPTMLPRLLESSQPAAYSYTSTASVEEALDTVTTRTFDLVLLDLDLTQSTDATKLIQLRTLARSASFLMISGSELSAATTESGPDCSSEGTLSRAMLAQILQVTAERRRLERERDRNAARFRAVVEHGSDLVFILDEGGAITYANVSAGQWTGISPGELVGRFLFQDLVHPDDPADILDAVKQAEAGSATLSPTEMRLRHQSGGWRFVQIRAHYHQEEPNGGAFVINAQDVTDRREAQEQLRQIVTSVQCLLWHALVIERDGEYPWELFIPDEEAAYRFLPIHKEPGQSYTDAWYWSKLEDDQDQMNQVSMQAILSGQPGYSQEFRCKRSDGEIRWLHEEARIERLSTGRWRVVGVVTDVTEHKQSQEALQASEERLRLALEAGEMGTFDASLVTGEETFSPQLERMNGFEPGTYGSSGKTFRDLIHPEDSGWVNAEIERSIAERSGMSLEFRIVRPDGSVRWQSSRGRAFYDPTGKPVRVQGVALDITERKEAEELNERQVKRLIALRTIDTAITASLDLRRTLDLVLDQVKVQQDADAASVLLLNRHSHTLEYVCGRGFRTQSFLRRQLRLGQGLAGRAARERQVFAASSLTEFAETLQFSEAFADEGFASYYAAPLVSKGQVQGVLEVFTRKPLKAEADWLDFLETLAGQAAIAIETASLFEQLERTNTDLSLAYDATIEGWSKALDLRDKETEGHTQRVTEMTVKLARSAGIAEAEIVHIRRGALLHDIGKMGIPDDILLKPGKLTDEEWVIMKKHPVFAYELLSPISFLRPALDIPYYHHEKWDGGGYPHGMKGEQIPLSARLFAVVDVWDALSSDRPYRAAWPKAKVMEHIRAGSGSHFDPAAIEAFMRLLEQSGGALDLPAAA